MVVITPVVAGPYDLGVIAVRTALEVDRTTAQGRATTDPLPQIYQGIPVRLRDIHLNLNRDQFVLNPTSCDPMQITSRITGTGGNLESTADDTAAELEERFQVANCASLGFKPRPSLRFKGGTKIGAHPGIRAVLRARPGDANIADTAVILPRSAFLDNAHINSPCTRPRFAAGTCPKCSILGRARAFTPLLDQPLEGPVYLRANGGERLLPDIVADLKGEIDIELEGHIDAVKINREDSLIRTTFASVPDAPVTKFVLRMAGGRKGLIQNSADLCRANGKARVRMTGQNGKRRSLRPVLKADCGKKGKKKRKHKRHRRG
jgi:hypothetical protein